MSEINKDSLIWETHIGSMQIAQLIMNDLKGPIESDLISVFEIIRSYLPAHAINEFSAIVDDFIILFNKECDRWEETNKKNKEKFQKSDMVGSALRAASQADGPQPTVGS